MNKKKLLALLLALVMTLSLVPVTAFADDVEFLSASLTDITLEVGRSKDVSISKSEVYNSNYKVPKSAYNNNEITWTPSTENVSVERNGTSNYLMITALGVTNGAEKFTVSYGGKTVDFYVTVVAATVSDENADAYFETSGTTSGTTYVGPSVVSGALADLIASDETNNKTVVLNKNYSGDISIPSGKTILIDGNNKTVGNVNNAGTLTLYDVTAASITNNGTLKAGDISVDQGITNNGYFDAMYRYNNPPTIHANILNNSDGVVGNTNTSPYHLYGNITNYGIVNLPAYPVSNYSKVSGTIYQYNTNTTLEITGLKEENISHKVGGIVLGNGASVKGVGGYFFKYNGTAEQLSAINSAAQSALNISAESGNYYVAVTAETHSSTSTSYATWTAQLDPNAPTFVASVASGSFATFEAAWKDMIQANVGSSITLLADAGVDEILSDNGFTVGDIFINLNGHELTIASTGGFACTANNWHVSNNNSTPGSIVVESSDALAERFTVASGNSIQFTRDNLGVTMGSTSDLESVLTAIYGAGHIDTSEQQLYIYVRGTAIPEPVYPTGVTLDQTDVTLNVGDDVVINATLTPENVTETGLSWAANHSDIVSFKEGTNEDAFGLHRTFEALKVGTAYVNASPVNMGANPPTAFCTITVMPSGSGTVRVYNANNDFVAGYNTLAEALAAETTVAGCTVMMSKDETLSTELTVGKAVTIDLNGRKISVDAAGGLNITESCTIRNGNVEIEGEDLSSRFVLAKGKSATFTKVNAKLGSTVTLAEVLALVYATGYTLDTSTEDTVIVSAPAYVALIGEDTTNKKVTFEFGVPNDNSKRYNLVVEVNKPISNLTFAIQSFTTPITGVSYTNDSRTKYLIGDIVPGIIGTNISFNRDSGLTGQEIIALFKNQPCIVDYSSATGTGVTMTVQIVSKAPGAANWTPVGDPVTCVLNPVAKIGGKGYATLQDAINAAVTQSQESNSKVTVELLDNVTDGTGLALFRTSTKVGGMTYPAATSANVEIDFGTHTYTVAAPAVGSTDTENQALHFESGNTVTLKNGTINMTNDSNKLAAFNMIMQNYGSLTIDNMTIDGTGIAVATYGNNYSAPWRGSTKPQFNFNNSGTSLIHNSTITVVGDMCIDDTANVTIKANAVINANKIVTKGTDERLSGANPTITVENGAKFKLTDPSFETLLNANGQTLGTAADGVYTVKEISPILYYNTWSVPNVFYFSDEDPIPQRTTQGTTPKIKRQGESSYHVPEDWVTISWKVTESSATTCDGASTTIATVDEDGLVTFNAPGTVKVWLVMRDPNGATKSGSKTVSYQVAPAYIERNDVKVAYATLLSAFNAAQSGETIVMGADCSAGNIGKMSLTDGRTITIDLNGHTASFNQNYANNSFGALFTVNNGTLNMISSVGGGSVAASGTNARAFNVDGGANNNAADAVLSIGPGVNVSSAADCCVTVFGKGTLNTAGNLTSGNDFAIAGNGSNGMGGYIINVTGGTISADDIAIYHCNDGELNVSGNASITGATAIYQKSGTMNITGGTITGNGAAADYTYWDNGANPTGDAIVIDNCGYPGGAPTANIMGATLASTNGKLVGYYESEPDAEATVLADKAYTLSTNALKDWVANTSDNKDTYPKTIGTVSYVAQIGNVKYTTLQAAFDNVQSGQTITLLDDLSIAGNNAEARLAGKTVTLDLGGHTLTGRTNLRSGNLTVTHGNMTYTLDGQRAIDVYGTDNSSYNTSNNIHTKLVVANDVTISGGSYGIVVAGKTLTDNLAYGVVVEMNGRIENTGVGIFVMGNIGNVENDTSMLEDGVAPKITVSGTINANGQGIALNGMANVTITSAAQITGREAIGVKRGILNITGGTFRATGTKVETVVANNSGTEETGAALSITSTYNYAGRIELNISGGSFESEHGLAFLAAESLKNKTVNKFASGNPILNITGGKYDDDSVKDYVASGYEAVALTGNDEAGWYQVGEIKSTAIAKDTTAINNDAQTTYTASRRVVDEDEKTIGNSNQPTVTVTLTASAGEVATNNELPQYDQEKIVAKALEVSNAANMTVSIDVESKSLTEVANNKITYEVHPKATVTSDDEPVGTFIVTNDMLSGQTFTIKLLVPEALRENGWVKVTHSLNNGGTVEYAKLKVDNGYVTIADVTEFSEFELEMIVVDSTPSANYGFTLALKDNIEIPFYVYNLSADASTYYVEYSYTNANNQQVHNIVKLSDYSIGDGWYRVVVASFSARQMGDTVHVKLYTDDNTIIYNDNYSIKTYCEGRIVNSTNEKLKNLCRATLDYGRAAQINFDYKADNLVSNDYFNDFTKVDIGSEYSASNPAEFGFVGTTISLKSQVVINFYFANANGYTYKVNGVKVDPEYSDTYTVIRVDGISAKNLDKQVTVTVSDGDTSQNFSYSPMNYAYGRLKNSNDSKLIDVCKALYLYCAYANDYLN